MSSVSAVTSSIETMSTETNSVSKRNAKEPTGTKLINFNFTQPQSGSTENQAKEALSVKEQQILDIAQKQLGDYYDVKVENGWMTISGKDKNPFLFNKSPHSLRAVKAGLALNDGVISKYNDEIYDFESKKNKQGVEHQSFFEGSTLTQEPSVIQIPTKEIGRNPNWKQRLFGTFNDLK